MKKLFLAAVCLLCLTVARSQSMKDPATWTTSVEAEKGSYNLVFHVSLQPGWHIWSLTPGGDGTLIPPSFDVEKGSYTLVGKPKEKGQATVEAMEGIDEKVRFFKDKADFIQTVKAKHGDIVKGSYTYQLCSDRMCLPPKTVPFSFRIP